MVCLFFFAEIRNCLNGVGYTRLYRVFPSPNIRRNVLSGCAFGDVFFHDMMNVLISFKEM